MPFDPQRFNLYAYTRNNPLKFIDPEGEAIRLSDDPEEKKRELEALRLAVGEQAGAYLYENKGTDDKYYVGIYTNGPDGRGPEFAQINAVAGEFGAIILHDKIASLKTVKEGAVVEGLTLASNNTCNCNPDATGVTVPDGYGNVTIYLPIPPKGSPSDVAGIEPVAPLLMSDGRPGYQDWGTVMAHELGHSRARMTGDPDTNGASLRLENKVRKLRNPKAPEREYHDEKEALSP